MNNLQLTKQVCLPHLDIVPGTFVHKIHTLNAYAHVNKKNCTGISGAAATACWELGDSSDVQVYLRNMAPLLGLYCKQHTICHVHFWATHQFDRTAIPYFNKHVVPLGVDFD